MPTPRSQLRLALIQIRDDVTPLQQERECFVERCGIEPEQIQSFNVADRPAIRFRDVESAHAVLIGGAGAYSATRVHPFTAYLEELVHNLVEIERPIWGACWGHQFLASILGGGVIEDHDRAEVGSFDIELTSAGRFDEVFGHMPRRFTVQLGHNDRVTRLGPEWTELAFSERCRYQAIRLHGKPVYGTQFHSEMNEARLRERLAVYMDAYLPDGQTFESLSESLRPSREADSLMPRFLHLYT
jgi:GMP synthase (glutamine-hydrolysing)